MYWPCCPNNFIMTCYSSHFLQCNYAFLQAWGKETGHYLVKKQLGDFACIFISMKTNEEGDGALEEEFLFLVGREHDIRWTRMSSVSQSGRRETKERSNLNRQSAGSVINSAAHPCRRRKSEDYNVSSLFTVFFWQTLHFFLPIMVLPRGQFLVHFP